MIDARLVFLVVVAWVIVGMTHSFAEDSING